MRPALWPGTCSRDPVVGVVHVAEDWLFVGGDEGAIYEETGIERQCERELMESGVYANSLTRNQGSLAQDSHEHFETFRITGL